MKLDIRMLVAAAGLFAVAASPPQGPPKILIAASTTDLASIASSVGGDQVEVFAIAKPTADPHRVEVLPSYMVKVAKARMYLKIGLGLDQWADGIIDGSRNGSIRVVDCSAGVAPLERPSETGSALAAQGDVHPFGNPHYWLDPRNGGRIARSVAGALGRLDPVHASDYSTRARAFIAEAESSYVRGQAIAATMPVKSLFTYHRSWSYLGEAFGLDIVGQVEPLPGIPPTAKHLQEIVNAAKAGKVPVLLQEPYFPDDAGKFLAREAGLRVIKASPACDSPLAGSYFAHIEAVLGQLAGRPPR